MKKTILTMTIIAVFTATTPVYASVDGITSDNYTDYVKPNADAYGYNIGECDRPYMQGEEYFYDEYTDHWNVDRVYDAEILKANGIIKDKPQKAKAKKHKKHKKSKKNKKSKKK